MNTREPFEEMLRRRLQSLPGLRTNPGLADEAARRAHRRRFTQAVLGAGVAVAVVATGVSFATASGESRSDKLTTTSPGDAGSSPSSEPTATPVATYSSGPTGPAPAVTNPTPGQPYSFNLYTHCGIQGTEFAGRSWAATTPTSTLPAGWTDPYQAGTITLLDANRLRFTGPGGVAYEFRPTDGQPLCH